MRRNPSLPGTVVYLAESRGKKWGLRVTVEPDGSYLVEELKQGRSQARSPGHTFASARREVQRRFRSMRDIDGINLEPTNDQLFQISEGVEPGGPFGFRRNSRDRMRPNFFGKKKTPEEIARQEEEMRLANMRRDRVWKDKFNYFRISEGLPVAEAERLATESYEDYYAQRRATEGQDVAFMRNARGDQTLFWADGSGWHKQSWNGSVAEAEDYLSSVERTFDTQITHWAIGKDDGGDTPPLSATIYSWDVRSRRMEPNARRMPRPDFGGIQGRWLNAYEDYDGDEPDPLGRYETEASEGAGRYFDPEYLHSGDYDSMGTVGKANIASFGELFADGEDEWWWVKSYAYGGQQIRIDTKYPFPPEVEEELLRVLGGLQDYPIIDEMKLSEVEMEEENDAWESWAQREFVTVVATLLEEAGYDEEEAERAAEELDDMEDALYELFRELSESANVYVEHSSEGPHFPFQELESRGDALLVADFAKDKGVL